MERFPSPPPHWALLAAFLLILGTAPAQAQFGITGGLNFESTDDIRNSAGGEAAFDNSTGYHLGVVYNLGIGPVDIRPGFLYRRVGTYELRDIPTEAGNALDGSFDVTAYEVPVDLRFTVLPTPVVSPYLLAGPQFTFVNGEDDFDDATEDLSFSLNVGAGTDITLPGLPITLQPELRYEFGATTFVKDDFEIGDVDFEPQDEPRFSAFSVRLTVLF
jgi:hypothetical protein